MATLRQRAPQPKFDIHHDAMEESMEEDNHHMEESAVTEEEESEASDSSDDEVDTAVQEDMRRFQESFEGIHDHFRLIKRIGEGTFSTVYKAEDLHYDRYDNKWDIEERENTSKWKSPPVKSRTGGRTMEDIDGYTHTRNQPKFVAIKKIYVTSSPMRILNELELLADLRGCDSVCPLITAFRCSDQVVAILPYFRHEDFRNYFRNMNVPDMQLYFRSLFTALAAVHSKGIIHRDIKPTNFLYEPDKKHGVLVDFGLAEWERPESKCICMDSPAERKRRVHGSVAATTGPSSGYPRNDSRPSRRANRAGTRGFRAPEVLLKCTAQTTKIDIWSAGVILLTILSRRFPFFNSADDVEAMIEITTIFGTRRMKQCAFIHGTMLETNIPTIGAGGFNLEKIILWSTCRNNVGDDQAPLTEEELLAVRFLERCFELDPVKRISAAEALEHPFLKEPGKEDAGDTEDDEMSLVDEE